MKADNLIQALRGLPEKRLRLLDLAWELVGEDGALDVQKAAFLQKELNLAEAEAEAYSEATKGAVWALREMARS